MRRTITFVVAVIVSAAFVAAVMTSCSRESVSPTQSMLSANLTSRPSSAQTAAAGAPERHEAYYDSSIFHITLVPMPAMADSAILYHNGQINQIYTPEPDDTGFVLVIDAIPTDGMNPMWQEAEIHFNEGFTPHQFYSDNQVLAAAGGLNPEITLVPTNEIYRCSVVGQKP